MNTLSSLTGRLQVLALTFIASIEAILSAIAIDKMAAGLSKNFNKEIIAKGLGNMISGIFGLTPLTGVVLRGSANIEAGANNRSSGILQGFWLILLVLFFSKYLSYIPKSCLAAILVYLSFRLINLKAIKELFKYGQNEINVFFLTVALIIVGNLLLGVIVGILLSFFHFLYSFTKFEYKVTKDLEHNKTNVYLRGYASFFNLPQISADLSKIPKDMNLHIKFGKLSYIDYAFFDFLQTWEQQYIQSGGTVFLEWDQLKASIFNPTKAFSLFEKFKSPPKN